MTPALLALLVAFVAVPLNWFVTFRLWRLSRAEPGLRVLRERAIVALALAIVMTVFGLIFLNNDVVPPPLSFDDSKWLTRGTLFLAGVLPALYWLWIYRDAGGGG